MAIEQLATHADRILAERDRFPGRLVTFLRALLLDRRFEAAAEIARPLISQDDLWRSTWLAVAASADPDITSEALLLAESVISGQPSATLDVANQWLVLAMRTGEEAHYERAEALARTAGEAPGLALLSLQVRGSVAAARGDLARAEPLFRAILTEKPDDLQALNNLAYALIRLSERCEEAAEISARALTTAPNNLSVLDTHARALACSGNPVEAETAVRLALTGRPNDPAILLTLVRVLVAQGRFAEAESGLARAEELLRRAGRPRGEASKDATELRARLLRQQPGLTP